MLAVFILTAFPNERHKRTHVRHSLLSNLRLVLRRPSASSLFICAMLYFMAPTLTVTFLPLYASKELGMPTVAVGLLIGSVYAIELISMPIIGYVADRYGRKRTIVAGLLVSFVLFLLYFAATNDVLLLLVSMGTGVAFAATSLLLTMIPDVTLPRMYGATVGVFGSFEDLGSIVGPLLFGLVWSTLGPVYIFAVTAITQLGAAFLVLRIRTSTNSRS